ncbi:hypothetical protein ACFYSC_14670 [Streptosporangium sp. NPDC004379]|uniref:hypothetical protein n=1 Tax=Streptosporangium sp. NPDC004379 TaxID=3366189 RepID=UPI0036A3F72F
MATLLSVAKILLIETLMHAICFPGPSQAKSDQRLLGTHMLLRFGIHRRRAAPTPAPARARAPFQEQMAAHHRAIRPERRSGTIP